MIPNEVHFLFDECHSKLIASRSRSLLGGYFLPVEIQEHAPNNTQLQYTDTKNLHVYDKNNIMIADFGHLATCYPSLVMKTGTLLCMQEAEQIRRNMYSVATALPIEYYIVTEL